MSHPIDPLTPEERALADRLARLGPHDGPSPALDAKILAAAHAAVGPRRRSRWLALSSVPASLITGAGMAAVLALVVGVVWQLRPSAPAPQAPREEGDMGYVSAQILERPTPAVAPAPPPAEAPAPARALTPPAAKRQAATAPANAARVPAAVAAAADTSAPEQDPHFVDEAVGTGAHSTTAFASEPSAAVESYSSAPAPSSPPAPTAAMSVPAPAAEQARAAATGAMQRKAVAGDSQARRRAEQEVAAEAKVEASVAADAAVAPAPELDAIQVTGSRTAVADLPVRGDSTLEPDAWLQRIRERRDTGDLDGARRSLVLFRKAHPGLRLPDDLRALAAPMR